MYGDRNVGIVWLYKSGNLFTKEDLGTCFAVTEFVLEKVLDLRKDKHNSIFNFTCKCPDVRTRWMLSMHKANSIDQHRHLANGVVANF